MEEASIDLLSLFLSRGEEALPILKDLVGQDLNELDMEIVERLARSENASIRQMAQRVIDTYRSDPSKKEGQGRGKPL